MFQEIKQVSFKLNINKFLLILTDSVNGFILELVCTQYLMNRKNILVKKRLTKTKEPYT